jgi:sugar transferase EpsL
MRELRSTVKRAFDLITAASLLIVLSPPALLVAAAVRLRLGKPVLFRQRRPGLHGAPFTLYKFRTMAHAVGPDGALLPDDERLTRFGSWLRSTSLDELPQLVNVLRGDMSLVGPRPLMPEYLERYTERQRRRHEVRPGLTGLAQVSGRNELPWEHRLELDVRYVEQWSLALDARILVRTALAVVRRRGVSAPGHTTMPRFQGVDSRDA